MTKKNTNSGINIFAIGFLMIALAICYYFLFALPNQNKTETAPITPAPIDNTKYYQQAKLDECIRQAEEHFASLMELNSYPAPQEGYPDARVWDSAYIKESTEDNLRKDKEICIQLYK